MTTTQITDHTAQALERLAGRDKDKPNIALLITALVNQVQDTEDAWWQLFVARSIDSAVGQQLDDLGKIVDQPRNGESDASYRTFLRARIAANNSDGLINDLIRVSRAAIDDTSLSINVGKGVNATLTLRIQSGELATGTADILIQFLRDAVMGGVRITLHYLTDTPANSFTFIDAADVPTVDTSKGFDDASSPGSGGYWAAVIE